MTLKTFTPDEVKFLSALRDEVLDKGVNHVYDKSESGPRGIGSCSYVNWRDGGETASCLIGRGLLNSGLKTIEELKGCEGTSAHALVPLSEDVKFAADVMQSKQDAGGCWGYAYISGILELSKKGYVVSSFII